MFDAQDFIDKTRNDIADDRGKAGWCKFASYAVRFVTAAVVITGVIESFALAPPEFNNGPFRIIREIGALAWNWMNDNAPPLWLFLRLISPYPRLTLPLPLLPWLSWVGYIYGLSWLGFKLLERSKFLSERASKTEEKLDFQEPLLLQIQSTQSGVGGNISGYRNVVVTAVNTINNIREKDEKNWWTLPTGIIGIGVVIQIICKFLQVS
jgi:hypothetical protein